jgi:hypothetical protein
MRTILALLFLLACSSTQAQEISFLSGKGVQHNPNTDSTAITVRLDAREFGPTTLYTEVGATVTSVIGTDYGRPFTSIQLGKQVEYTFSKFFVNASLGAALASRTSDGPEYAIAPYGSVFVGVRHRGISAGFGQWILYNPTLHYRWTINDHPQGERWTSAVFTGFRIGIDLDIKRAIH